MMGCCVSLVSQKEKSREKPEAGEKPDAMKT